MKILAVLLLLSTAAFAQANKCAELLEGKTGEDAVTAYVSCLVGPGLVIYDRVQIKTIRISRMIEGIPFFSTKVVALNVGKNQATCVVTLSGTNKILHLHPGEHASALFRGAIYDESTDTFLCVAKSR